MMISNNVCKRKDIPMSRGRINACMNAALLCNAKYTVTAKFPWLGGMGANQTVSKNDKTAGTTVRNYPYSNTSNDAKFIGIDVSPYTFMSAVQNPKSVVYTKIAKDFDARSYYGMVCSVVVNAAFRLDQIVCQEFPNHSDMFEKISWDDAQPGDFLRSSSHAIFLMDIVRNDEGIIQKYTFCESAQSGSRIHSVFAANIDSYKSYDMYRFKLIDDVSFIGDEWFVRVSDSDYSYPDVIPNYGDKCSILPSDEFTLNIINSSGYTSLEVYKDGELYGVYSVSDVTLPNLSHGHYEGRLIGNNKTSSCYWIVADCNAYYADGRMYYSSENSIPTMVNNHFTQTVNSDGYFTARNESNKSMYLSEKNIVDGYCDVSTLTNGSTYLSVHFHNEYGGNVVNIDIS